MARVFHREKHKPEGCNTFECFDNAIEPFCRGANSNRSIQKTYFTRANMSGGELFRSLCPFFGNDSNLSELVVKYCQFGAGCARQIALALRDCNKSLKRITLVDNWGRVVVSIGGCHRAR